MFECLTFLQLDLWVLGFLLLLLFFLFFPTFITILVSALVSTVLISALLVISTFVASFTCSCLRLLGIYLVRLSFFGPFVRTSRRRLVARTTTYSSTAALLGTS